MTQIPSSAPPSFSSSSCLSRSARSPAKLMTPAISPATGRDYSSDIPDECLELIFQSLGSGDRKRCSLVCRRWLVVDGRSRHRLSLDARSLELIFQSLGSGDRKRLSLTVDGRSRSPRRRSLDLHPVRLRHQTRIRAQPSPPPLPRSSSPSDPLARRRWPEPPPPLPRRARSPRRRCSLVSSDDAIDLASRRWAEASVGGAQAGGARAGGEALWAVSRERRWSTGRRGGAVGGAVIVEREEGQFGHFAFV